jgi:threonine/homoserine/homoserine lactone efflux protein
MSWSKYAEFLAFAAVLVLIPGPDFAVVTKNTLVGGRRRGRWTALGVSSSNLVQGTAAAFGLSALVVRVQPLFEAIKWAGVGYLAYLGVQAIRSALRGQYQPVDEADGQARGLAGWRQGFISNITNPRCSCSTSPSCRSSSPRARASAGCSCWPGAMRCSA